MDTDNGSQGTLAKSKSGVQTIRPVTIKQLCEAEVPEGSDAFFVDNGSKSTELSQV
jgi:hypothetical protein